MPPEKHNPTAEERDERIGPFDVDPVEALAAILNVNPKSEPVTVNGGAIDQH
jgi:hypothetical protein